MDITHTEYEWRAGLVFPSFTSENKTFRPFVADDVDDRDMPAPLRGSISYHSVNELTNSQFGTIKWVISKGDSK